MPASLAPWLTPHVVTWTIIALSVLGVILRPFRWPEFIWAATGAVLLVALRLLLYPLRPEDLRPQYWVGIGATAIPVLAGARKRWPDDDALLADVGGVLDSLHAHFSANRKA